MLRSRAYRMKVQLKTLTFHIMRHFSIANLSRLGHVKATSVDLLEMEVRRRVVRRIGPPPSEIQSRTLSEFPSILYRFQADHHKRKDGKPSQLMQDMQSLCSVANGDITDATWVHWCWDEETQKKHVAKIGAALWKIRSLQ